MLRSEEHVIGAADALEGFRLCRHPQRLFLNLSSLASVYGFDRVAYGALRNVTRTIGVGSTAPEVFMNYPKTWSDHYFHEHYDKIDPVVTATPFIRSPYRWATLNRLFPLTQRQKLFFAEAASVGLKSGISIPLHGVGCDVAVVSFASSMQEADPERYLGGLYSLAMHFHLVLQDLIGTPQSTAKPQELSRREIDCLQWVARGKSSWDIGMILNVSETTATFHIKNAMRKLGTNNRTAAVVAAMHLGLLQL